LERAIQAKEMLAKPTIEVQEDSSKGTETTLDREEVWSSNSANGEEEGPSTLNKDDTDNCSDLLSSLRTFLLS
jgi:hypothetical protein